MPQVLVKYILSYCRLGERTHCFQVPVEAENVVVDLFEFKYLFWSKNNESPYNK